MNFSAKIFLFSLFLLSVNTAKNNIYKWKVFYSPSKTSTTFLTGKSFNNFYLTDKFGNLFHHKNAEWEKYSLPKNNYARYIWGEIEKNKFIVACMDTKWKTHFYILEKGKWKKLKYINPTPVHGIKNINNCTYLYGNFGTFLKLVNDKIIPVTSKIENHINYIFSISEKKIYLIVKAEGIYKYNGKVFTHIPFPNNKYNEVHSMELENGKLIVRDIKNKTYQIECDTLKRITLKNKLNTEPEKEDFGFRKLSVNHGDSLIIVNFPNSIPLSGYTTFGDTILITTLTKKIYIGTKSVSNYFIDMAPDYNIPGISNITALGSAFIQNDSDSNLDIFILYNAKHYASRLYKNIPSSPLLDISASSNLFSLQRPYTFYFADFTGNKKPDLFTITLDSVSTWLNIFSNKSQFIQTAHINLGKFIKIRNPRSVKAIDYDMDGDLDISLTYYYGEGPKSGKLLFFKNKLWATEFEPDTSLFNESKGWNISSAFADFNNDDKNDFFLITMWRLNKLLVNNGTTWINETDKRFNPLPKYDANAGAGMDYDNDGDLDIFILTNEMRLIIYDNNGNGYFTKSSVNVELEASNFISNTQQSLNFGDFNNDGYTDIFITNKKLNKAENIILINDSAKQFINQSECFNIKSPFVYSTSIGDIDNDGDLDILGTTYGKNLLWINNLNNNNFLEFILNGSKSNSVGLHAKIYVYKEGGLNDSSKLIAFKQSGSFNSGINSQNSPVIHFGVNSKNKYDVKIKFYGGKTKILKSVSAGQIIPVYENTQLLSSLILLPRLIYTTITSKTVHIYFTLMLLGFILLFLEIYYAGKKFRRNTLLTSIIIVSNLSLYYLILFLTSNENTIIIKYFLPVSVLIFGLIFTDLIFIIIKKYQTSDKKSEEEYLNDLLTQIMQFTHGEWALRNLNSLHLFCSNPLEKYEENYLNQFEERKNTFLKFTAPAINQILLIHSKINKENSQINIISTSYKLLLQMFAELQPLRPTKNKLLQKISGKIYLLIKALSELKKEVFKEFSCNIIQTSESIIKSFSKIASENNIEIILEDNLVENTYGLIKNYELADILDNAVKNSIKALKSNTKKKKIRLILYNNVPHICIDIIDNGCGMKKEKWEKVFEQGFTESKSTGFGLNFSQKLLNKYGGRIFVKESVINKGTIFTIEMIEGVKYAETVTTDN